MNRFNVTYSETVVIESQLSAEEVRTALYNEGIGSAIEEVPGIIITDRINSSLSVVPLNKLQ